jgi:hypothetical protein
MVRQKNRTWITVATVTLDLGLDLGGATWGSARSAQPANVGSEYAHALLQYSERLLQDSTAKGAVVEAGCTTTQTSKSTLWDIRFQVLPEELQHALANNNPQSQRASAPLSKESCCLSKCC